MASRLSTFSVIQLDIELMEAGKRLLLLPSSSSELLHVLAKLERILHEVQQFPSESMKYAMHPIIETLIAKELVRHPDMDVNISVACCICEILRIMAPNAPYNDQQMKDFFELATMTFEKLSTASGGCYTKMTTVLKTFSSVRLPVLMLDLQLDKLVVRLFRQFLTVADFNSSADVREMEKIMTMIIEESQQPMLELVVLLVKSVRKDNQIALPVCWKLGEKVLKNCAGQLKPHLPDIIYDMGFSLQECSETITCICNWSSNNEAMVPLKKQEAKKEINSSTTHRSKLECTNGSENTVPAECYSSSILPLSFTNDPSLPSKPQTQVKEKCQNNFTPSDKQDDANKLRKDTIHKRELECMEVSTNMMQTVRACQQATMHTVNLPGIHSEDGKKHENNAVLFSNNPIMLSKSGTVVKGKRRRKYAQLKKLDGNVNVSSARNQGSKSEPNRSRKIRPNPSINISLAEAFFTRLSKKNEKNTLLLSDNLPTPSKSETEVKGKHKRKRTPLNKKKLAPKMAKSVKCGENLVGRNIKVWWPMDETYYEGVVASFNHLTSKHKVCYVDGDEEILNLDGERWELVENVCTSPISLVQELPIKVSSPQSGVLHVQGYKVKQSVAPILKAIFMKHGDIAANCLFKTASVRVSFLELVCEIVSRIQSNDVITTISEMEKIESEISEAEAANVDVSWLRAHLETFHRRKKIGEKCSLLMEMKAKTLLVKRAAELDLGERCAELVSAQERLKMAERCVKVLNLVEKKLNNDILESRTEQDSWAKPPIL